MEMEEVPRSREQKPWRRMQVVEGPLNVQPSWPVIAVTSFSGLAFTALIAALANWLGLEPAVLAVALTAPLLIVIGIFSRPANPVFVLSLAVAAPVVALSTAAAFDGFTVSLTPGSTAPAAGETSSLMTLSVQFGHPSQAELTWLIGFTVLAIVTLALSRLFNRKDSVTTA